MGAAKQQALDLIQKLPESVSTSNVLDELYFKEQIDRGLRDVIEDRMITHKELKERLIQWRKSAGR